jgi:hypothetical protein
LATLNTLVSVQFSVVKTLAFRHVPEAMLLADVLQAFLVDVAIMVSADFAEAQTATVEIS